MIRYTTTFALLAAATLGLSQQPAVLHDFGSLKWQHRIVVINEVNNQTEVMKLLESRQVAVGDRDILWFIFDGDEVFSNFSGDIAASFSAQIRQQYQLETGQVILLGKDGGLKSRSDGVDLDAIFSEIDAMPMRQREKRLKKPNN